ncbi:MAG: M48 family metallopeptidase, partial [Gemmobacter sp.]
PGAAAGAGARVAAFLRLLARDRLAAACDAHAARAGRRYVRLVLRDTRSRWGSCTAQGALMFNWRLAMAPPAVLDYVAAHEVAHLVRMDHSPAFWAEVERLRPGHAADRAWLRRHGGALHGWRFDTPAED